MRNKKHTRLTEYHKNHCGTVTRVS